MTPYPTTLPPPFGVIVATDPPGMANQLQRIEEKIDKVEEKVGGIDDRLRKVETDVTAIKTTLKSVATTADISRIDTTLKHVATKKELQELKVWALSGVVGGMILAASLALAVARLFPPSTP